MSKLASRLIKENKKSHDSFLDLGNCGLENELPQELFECIWLERINLGDSYFIFERNKWVNSSNKGKKNIFNGNELFLLKKLIKLEVLCLSDNQIQDINFLEGLNQLQILDLRYNQIQDISPIKKLNRLQTLNLRRNQVRDISPLENHIKLQTLNLSDNLIKDISYLEKLTQLQNLDLRKNQIQDISSLLYLLKKGLHIEMNSFFAINNSINLTDNRISSPPLKIIQQGRDAIIQYFEALKKQGKDYIYEAKLTLVGDGGAGKTSLQKRIINTGSPLPKQEERTRGIEIAQWNFIYQQDKKFVVHIWDFGGQDVYYPVHRFFLTENCVFTLLGSTRTAMHNFEYWVPTIYQFGGKSPIILVQNCFDGNKAQWSELGAFFTDTNFNLIKPFYCINLPNDNEGLVPLQEVIKHQIINLPHIGEAVPKSWLKVREALTNLAKNKPYVSFEQFISICENTDTENFQDKKVIKTLARYFHDLGIILWYYDKVYLQEWVILQPEWLMNAVYKIIDDTIIQNQKGIIHEQDFNRLWSNNSYEDKHELLKELLGIFKIAFPKKSKKTDFILPARLLPIVEKKKWGNSYNIIQLEYHFNFIPRGIVNQVSADLSSLIVSDEQVWNNAVIFKQDTSQAQVLEDIFDRKIYIKAYGKDARSLVLMIIKSIEDILNDYKGVTPIKHIPCNCPICKKNTKPVLFEYDELLELSKLRDTVTCYKSDTKLIIESLLFNSDAISRKTNENNNKQRGKSSNVHTKSPEIFFSYAWKDKDEVKDKSREKIVHDLYESLKQEGYTVVIDKKDVGYKDMLNNFMQRIGKGDVVVVAISDKYLKSVNCMYELYEIYRNSKMEQDEFIEKIYPILIEKIDFNKVSVIDNYFDFWENLKNEWGALVKKRGTQIGINQTGQYNKIKDITNNLGDLLDILRNVNSLNNELISENNFEVIKKAIEEKTLK